jgi:hypothetical protein
MVMMIVVMIMMIINGDDDDDKGDDDDYNDDDNNDDGNNNDNSVYLKKITAHGLQRTMVLGRTHERYMLIRYIYIYICVHI